MKPALFEMLVCPACRAKLEAEAWQASGSVIQDGLLRCNCGQAFPVIGGVPRLLLGAFRRQLWENYPAYFARHAAQLPECLVPSGSPTERAHAAAVQTQESFGYEWTRFASMRPAWERNYWGYLAPKSAEFLQGKTVLDAGCGMGRHLHFTAQHCAEVVGVDFSRAVDVAHRNTSTNPRAHVVQADLHALPFRRDTFDFVYSLGVIHHLPDPEAAFHELLTFVKPGGEIRVYLYWSMEGQPWWKRALLSCSAAMRIVTTRLPHGVLFWLCYPTAAGLWVGFVAPYALLRKIPALRGWAEGLPLRQYADYPFGVLVNDTFDRLSAPIENRYSAQAVRAWLKREGLNEVEVLPYAGWLGHGCKTGPPSLYAPTLAQVGAQDARPGGPMA